MSMSAETAAAHKNDPAVVCCRTEEGTILSADNLEDPGIFPDLVDSGLITLSDDVLTVGQVIGGKLLKTIDSLTPLTAEIVEGYNTGDDETAAEAAPAEDVAALATVAVPAMGGVFKLHIGEGKGIDLEIPLGLGGAVAGNTIAAVAAQAEAAPVIEDIVKHELTNMTYRINKVELGAETKIEGDVLTIRETAAQEAADAFDLVKSLTIDVLYPGQLDVYSNTIMDMIPIATKVEGDLGKGSTYEIVGAVAMLTGIDEAGKQISDANSSDGILKDHVFWDRPGAFGQDEVLIRFDVVIKEGTAKERPGPYAAHQAMDVVLQEIRDVLKKIPKEAAEETRVYKDLERKGRPRILIIKEIMGQGAMHDNVILPTEPAGVQGGRPNVDLGNLPVMLTPNEVRDGGIHALTCITPTTKETTRHYWRDPLVELLAEDEEIDLIGIMFVGSPQANVEKFYVSDRLGRWVDVIKPDGVIITTEGYGNNHVDFSQHINQVGELGIPVVGSSFCAVQGALVVGNKHMDALVEHGVSPKGLESDRLSENTMDSVAAKKALAMLKNKMMGEPILPPNRQWDPEVMDQNKNLVLGK